MGMGSENNSLMVKTFATIFPKNAQDTALYAIQAKDLPSLHPAGMAFSSTTSYKPKASFQSVPVGFRSCYHQISCTIPGWFQPQTEQLSMGTSTIFPHLKCTCSSSEILT